MARPDPGARCAGERRHCGLPAVVVRQGRALCSECDERRREGKRRARRRRRQREAPAEAERAARILREYGPRVVAVMAELEDHPCEPHDAWSWVRDALELMAEEEPHA